MTSEINYDPYRYTTAGVIAIISDAPPGAPAPDVYKNPAGHIEFEWYFGNGNLVDLSIGDRYGDGVIFWCYNGACYHKDYSPRLLKQLITKQMELLLNASKRSNQTATEPT